MPKFSVIITVLNKEEHIARTIHSVLNQTFSDFEIIILNDGSTDKSAFEILKFQDTRIRYFEEENKGAAAARNFAIKKAKGEYIALLDADDLWDNDYLYIQNQSIKQFPSQKVFATAIKRKIKHRTIECDYSIEKKETVIVVNYFEASLRESILHSSSTVLKKEVFDLSGYYNPDFKSGEDIDLYIRIGLLFKVVFNTKSYVTYDNTIKNSLDKSSRKDSDKPTFKEYELIEKTNPSLKKFLDLNRYSLCLIAKLENNQNAFSKRKNKIDLNNLNKKQRFLLNQNYYVIKYLKKAKLLLDTLGLHLSAFK